jgi:hypothetical protein
MLVCKILVNFTRRTKPSQIFGDPDNQRPDKWSFTARCTAESRNKFWKKVTEEEGSPEDRGVDGKTKGGRIGNSSVIQISVQWRDMGLDGGRKHGKPWLGKGPKGHKNFKK